MAKTEQAIRCSFAGLIVLYRACISPWWGQRCRFYPSCSQYALAVLAQQRLCCALKLITYRLLKCHPWHPGGCDHPPSATVCQTNSI